MFIHEFMSTSFIRVTPTATIKEVIQLFEEKKQDLAIVFQHEQFIGIVTKYSLYRLLLQTNSLQQVIKEAIIEDVFTINENDLLYGGRHALRTQKLSNVVVINEQKQVTGVISKNEIITGFIHELDSHTQQQRNILNYLHDAVITVNEHMQITFINKSCKETFHTEKLEVNELLTTYFPDFLPLIQHVLHTKEMVEQKMLIYHFSCLASILPMNVLNVTTGVIIVLKDLTKLEKIASELETTKKMELVLQNALDASYDGVVITNGHGQITRINDSLLQLIERNEKQVLDESIHGIFPMLPPFPNAFNGMVLTLKKHRGIVSGIAIQQEGQLVGMLYKFVFQQLHVWKELLGQIDQLEDELSFYRGELVKAVKHDDYFNLIVTNDLQLIQLKQQAFHVAKSLSTILITGESGTGKELFANGIHQASGRSGAFIKINCAAIPEQLIESELFGYSDGAFTGAKRGGKPGKFELAEGGTLFLDEIGDMPLSTQVKLLRVLQEREYERLGDTKVKKADVRIIAATNKHLPTLIQEGSFREDLYYRIHVIPLHIPPLRERKEDIPLLVEALLHKISIKHQLPSYSIDQHALQVLLHYDFVGNIRELENILERAIYLSPHTIITQEHIMISPIIRPLDRGDSSLHKDHIGETERRVIVQAIKSANGNKSKAAKLLGISRSTFYYKCNKYNIS
ncbi:sigma 54-interacting transcriptional regulator [Lysinibacillus sp. NPDC097287]|uniref:sigma 54-interacting transcriptional regulator n=1 Tax=Lysinibacillus sp. NPDC097287 TaxID=3364144 RepID=UPI0037F72414